MKDAADYLVHIKALTVVNPQVMHWTVVREEAQGDMGLFRYRLTFDYLRHTLRGPSSVVRHEYI